MIILHHKLQEAGGDLTVYSYEQDYIMRIVQQIVRMLLKLVFNIESVGNISSFLESEETRAQYTELIKLADKQKINEAENKLYEILETTDRENLKLSILFYDYLNSLDDGYLREADFSRAEIESGIKTVARMYGYGSIIDTLLFPSE